MTIPGIGPLGSIALLAAIGQGRQFKKAGDLSGAWLGFVPRQYSTGGQPTLPGISNRGNGYVRQLLIHGARSRVMHLDRSRTRLGAWIDKLEKRMHANRSSSHRPTKLSASRGSFSTGQERSTNGSTQPSAERNRIQIARFGE